MITKLTWFRAGMLRARGCCLFVVLAFGDVVLAVCVAAAVRTEECPCVAQKGLSFFVPRSFNVS